MLGEEKTDSYSSHSFREAKAKQKNQHYSRTRNNLLRLCGRLQLIPSRYQKYTVTEPEIMEKNRARPYNRKCVRASVCVCACVCMFTIRVQSAGKTLCLCIMQLNQILVIITFVKCITNNTRKEAIEKRRSPWLFSWYDHGWMSASVRRGLENIKGGENQHVKSNTSLQRKSTNIKTITIAKL